jgi:cell division protein FtsZ
MMAPGLVNLDFADIRTVMAEMGKAMMGTGEADGENRAIRASEAAISNPLLEDTSMAGARGLLINITGGDDLTLFEVDQAANRIREEVDEEANIIFGSAIDETLSGRIRVSVVATGIDTPVATESRPRLVAVAGGAMPAPQPIPMPAHAAAMTAQPVHASVLSATALRQPAVQMRAQTEHAAEENAVPAAETPPAAQPAAVAAPSVAVRVAPVAVPKTGSGLFAEARPTAVGAVPPAATESPRSSLFNTVTGAFRRRQAPQPAAAEPGAAAALRQEPAVQGEARVAEAPRASVRLAPIGGEEAALEIPAFLRRQTS